MFRSKHGFLTPKPTIMRTETLDQVAELIQELELVIKLRDMRLIDAHQIIIKMDPDKVDRLARYYWAIDIVDLLDIQAKAYRKYCKLADISELTKILKP